MTITFRKVKSNIRQNSNLSSRSQIEWFIGVEEVCHIETIKKYLRYQWSYCIIASQWLYWSEKMISKRIFKRWRWSYRTNSTLGGFSIWCFYWRGGSMSYWHSQKVTQISMKLLYRSLTMAILIWVNDMKMDWEVLKMTMHT